MSNEEAIKQLKAVTIYHEGKTTREALDMAIKQLDVLAKLKSFL